MLKQTRLGRDDEGRLRVKRVYEFEFSDTGDNRHQRAASRCGRNCWR